MRSLILHEKPAKMLILLRDGEQSWFVSSLARNCEMSYVHATKIVSRLQKAGVVSTTFSGRTKKVHLTQKGAEIASALDLLFDKLVEEKVEKVEKKAEKKVEEKLVEKKSEKKEQKETKAEEKPTQQS